MFSCCPSFFRTNNQTKVYIQEVPKADPKVTQKLLKQFLQEADITQGSSASLQALVSLIKHMIDQAQCKAYFGAKKSYLDAKQGVMSYLEPQAARWVHKGDFNQLSHVWQFPEQHDPQKIKLVAAFQHLVVDLGVFAPVLGFPRYQDELVSSLSTMQFLNMIGINYDTLGIHNAYLFSHFENTLGQYECNEAKKWANRVWSSVMQQLNKNLNAIYTSEPIIPDSRVIAVLNQYGAFSWVSTMRGEKAGEYILQNPGSTDVCATFTRFDSALPEPCYIARGGYGLVYKGITPQGPPVAIKLMELSNYKKDLSILFNEVDLSRQVTHKHILPIKHAFLTALSRSVCQVYFVMDYCEKGNLKQVLNDPSEVIQALVPLYKIQWMIDICSAIEALHQVHISHADIKLENILVDGQFQVKLSDFGLAARFEEEPNYPRYRGTMRSLPPEVFFTLDAINPEQRDVWQFGVLAYELKTKEYPVPMQSEAIFKSGLKNFCEDPTFREQRLALVENEISRAVIDQVLIAKVGDRSSARKMRQQLNNFKDKKPGA